MKLFIAADHAGVEIKKTIKKHFPKIQWEDLGAVDSTSVNYPDFAQKLCSEVKKTFSKETLLKPCGILICGSGVGMSIAANRISEIRAVLAHRTDVAKLSRNHNASNVLCLGARINTESEIVEIVREWMGAEFEGGRHLKRVELVEINE